MKKIAIALMLLFSCAALTACTQVESSSAANAKANTVATKQQAMQKALQDNPEIEEGATVSTYINDEGNQQFSYKNTDGTGGGGVIFD